MRNGNWSLTKKAWVALKYILDPKVPLNKKIWLLLALVYLISPIDVIPDPVFGLGMIDDVGLILLILTFMTQTFKDYAQNPKSKHKLKQDADTIDVDYEIVDEDEK